MVAIRVVYQKIRANVTHHNHSGVHYEYPDY